MPPTLGAPKPPTRLRCELEYQVQAPSHFVFQLECANSWDQTVEFESLTINPSVPVRPSIDTADTRIFRLDLLPCNFQVRYEATVHIHRPKPTGQELESAVSDIPDAVLPYLMPTRFCPSDAMSQEVQHLFGGLTPGYGRVAAISQWIHDNIEYQVGTSDSLTTAQDAYNLRKGVCRDFAHLGITFCRALNIPARLVGGYCHFDEPPQDFHAVFEVWLGGGWVMFDPTQLIDPLNLVRVATGTDAKNTAFTTVYGAFALTYMHLQTNHDGRAPSDNPDPAEATVQRYA